MNRRMRRSRSWLIAPTCVLLALGVVSCERAAAPGSESAPPLITGSGQSAQGTASAALEEQEQSPSAHRPDLPPSGTGEDRGLERAGGAGQFESQLGVEGARSGTPVQPASPADLAAPDDLGSGQVAALPTDRLDQLVPRTASGRPTGVSVAQLSVDGSLSDSRARSAVERGLPALARCPARVGADERSPGSITLAVTITPEGELAGVEAQDSQLSEPLTDCITRHFHRIGFPVSPGVSQVTVRLNVGLTL